MNEIKWRKKNPIIQSIIFGIFIFASFWLLFKFEEPPEGHIFKQIPVIRGIYECCEAGGRYSRSWVGSVGVNCYPIGYFEFLGTNRNDCGLKRALSGRYVEVTQAIIPSMGERSPLVVKIVSDGHSFYEVSDQELRNLWISGSIGGAMTMAFIFGTIFHAVQLILMDRRLKTPKESRK